MQILVVKNAMGAVIGLLAASALWVWPSPMQSLLLFGVGFSMTAAQVFILTSMRDGDASYVTPFIYTTLVFATALDFFVFGDLPDAMAAFGALTILAGAVFLAVSEGRVMRRVGAVRDPDGVDGRHCDLVTRRPARCDRSGSDDPGYLGVSRRIVVSNASGACRDRASVAVVAVWP